MPILPIVIVTAIAIICGVLIYIAFLRIPQKVKGLEKTEEISSILPGQNCGACGYPGCFGFAQALTQNPELIRNTSCALTVQDADRLQRLGTALGLNLDASAMSKKALVHCSGGSSAVYNYSGTDTCKGVSLLLGGNKKCPFACLGCGDCAKVCPTGAITIDPEKNVAVVDWNKCVGCGLCVSECPQNIIELVSSDAKIGLLCSYTPIRNIPGRERCENGCTHCRRCVRACEFGAVIWDEQKLMPKFDASKCTLCLKCVEVCPAKCLGTLVPREKGTPVAVAAGTVETNPQQTTTEKQS